MEGNQSPIEVKQEQEAIQKVMNDREMLVIFLAILGLALPALAIRNLFPDLNPLLLAGLGIAVYGLYLGWFLRANHLLSADKQVSPQTVTVNATNGRPVHVQRGQNE